MSSARPAKPEEQKEAKRLLPKLMVEGLFLGGSGLGVLALISRRLDEPSGYK